MQIYNERPHTYIIAEIGINHNGDIKIAKKLIDVAAFCGCDAVKFQKRTLELCIPEGERDKERDTPWGRMTYFDYKKRIEFEKEEYDELFKYAEDKEIDIGLSVWDMPSLEFAIGYDSPFIKVPSAMLTHKELLEAVGKLTEHRPIVSTGMSTTEEISSAVWNMWVGNRDVDPVLMHCNSSYPSKTEELNLLCIPQLMDDYACEVGYSGHEFGLTPTFAAVALGATFVERHITLDRDMWGTDQLSSVEPMGLFKLVKGIRDIERALGDGVKRVYPSELPSRTKLRGS